MLETVERDRPVLRATSERLATPSIRSASITRSRFDSRSEPSDPDSSLLTAGHPYPSGGVCQGSGENIPVDGMNMCRARR